MQRVSIITTVYNNRELIADAIQSVISQTYACIEYIVIDGASTDGTTEIVRQYANQIDRIVVEEDSGIYDALNKGISLATGEVVGFLHSDDMYHSSNAVEKIMSVFNDTEAGCVYGDLNYVDRDDPGSIVRVWKGGEWSPGKMKYGWMPPHPTFYVKRSIYRECGGFDTRYRISADYDSILRVLRVCNTRSVYIPEVLVDMRVGGVSNRGVANILKKMVEDWLVVRRNGVGGVGSVFCKSLRKINQFWAV